MAKWVEIRKGADFRAIGEKYGISPFTARLIRNKDIVGDQEIEEYKRIRNGIPISTLNKYYCDHFFDNIYRWEYFDFDGGKLDLMPSDREKYNVYKILDSSEKSLVNRLLVRRNKE